MSPDPRREVGRLGEELARQHLERLGYCVLESNYRTRWGELDLIVFDGRTIAFCEVKARRSGWGSPLDKIGPGKARRVRRMAAQWLTERSERPRAAELRFDAIGITVDAAGRLLTLEHLEGAF